MKNIAFTLLSLYVLLFWSCAKKEEVTPINEPAIEVLTTIVALKEGEEFTIKGANFSETETYLVKFNEVAANLVKISKTELTVTIPENITSGDITLEHNGKVTVVGSFIVSSTPSVQVLATTVTIKPGETFVIKGTNFNEAETYLVKFNGVTAEITKVIETELTVTIPESITSGDITIEHNGEIIKVGTYQVAAAKIYIFHQALAVKKLAELNPETGDLTYVTGKVDYGNNSRGIVYDKVNKEFIGFDYTDDFKPFIVKMKLDGSTSEKIYIQGPGGNFRDLVMDKNGKVYIFQYDPGVNKLAEINLATGELTYVTDSVSYGNNSRGIIYHEMNDEFIGFDYTDDFKPFIVRMKLDGTTSGRIYLQGSGGNFRDLVMDKNGKVYVFQYDPEVSKLAELNLETGGLTYVTERVDYGNNSRGIVYDQVNDEFIGFDYTNDFKPFTVKMKRDGTSTAKVYIKESFLASGSSFRDLIIVEE